MKITLSVYTDMENKSPREKQNLQTLFETDDENSHEKKLAVMKSILRKMQLQNIRSMTTKKKKLRMRMWLYLKFPE
jgi:hypothetical protein